LRIDIACGMRGRPLARNTLYDGERRTE